MSKFFACIVIILSALATFASGMFDIYHHNPSSFYNELSIYLPASVFALLPFYVLTMLTEKEKSLINFILVTGSLIMGTLGVKIYLGETHSNNPSWGFSIILVPVFQAFCLIVTWMIIVVKKKLG